MNLLLITVFAAFLMQGNPPTNLIAPSADALHPPVNPVVEIRRTADGHIAAVVRNHNDLQYTYFVLKTMQPVQIAAPIRLDNVNVTYSGECVVFQSRSDNKVIILRLSSANCPIQTTANATIYEGFGLIRQREASIYTSLTNAPGVTYPPVAEIVKCDCIEENTPDQGNCDAGGQGASECSYSESAGGGSVSVSASCTVKCGNGYYACCYDN
ncbi:MAG: hypothetical protein IT259_01995 [Saprospiraceae bacterium]|nr:hypothetical protein [Saprospiraceae bacterium]